MDTNREIVRIESKSLDTKQFDDLYLEMKDGKGYRIQAKNYPDTRIEDIDINDNVVKIKTNENRYNKTDENIMIINTNEIDANTEFMGLPAVTKQSITTFALL